MLGVRQMTVIALVAVMMLVAKMALRLPIKVSGHGGVLWIAALLVGTAVVRRAGASALMGLIGGTLVAIFQPGDTAMFFTIGKYVLPGLVLEMLAPLLGWRFDSVLPAVFAGAAAHASKVLVDVLQGLVAGLSGAFLMTGVTAELLLHIAFGALGGLVAALVLRTLIRAEIPQLAPIVDRGDAE
jgi:hypothetical protein